MNSSNFAGRLRELREGAGLSRKDLAAKAGMKSEAGIRNLEQGIRSPSWETVLALAAALGIDCNAFQQTPAPDQAPAKTGRPKKPSDPAEDLTRLPIDDLRKRVGDELEAAKSEPAKKPRAKKGGTP